MYLIVGLGNPGSQYEGSRHNLGFKVVEALARRLESSKPTVRHRSLCAMVAYRQRPVLLAQPLTYMNLSGRAVNDLVRDYDVDLSEMLVIYDDLDLPPGMIRLRQRGGSAGHRGLQSILDSLGTDRFARLRIGIGRAPGGIDAAAYVLMPILEADRILLDTAVASAVEAALQFVADGLETAMNHFNRSSAAPES